MGSPFKMAPKTPLMKALIGKQKNLPEHLKQAILDAPAKMTGDKTDAQLKAQREFTTGAGKGKRKVKTKTPTSIYVKKEKTASAITPRGVEDAAAKSTDKYGKKHSRLRKKSQKLEDKAMNYPGNPKVSDKKANKLLDKSEKAKNKARAIRNNSPAKSYGKSPAKMIGNYKMTSIKQKVKRNAKK